MADMETRPCSLRQGIHAFHGIVSWCRESSADAVEFARVGKQQSTIFQGFSGIHAGIGIKNMEQVDISLLS